MATPINAWLNPYSSHGSEIYYPGIGWISNAPFTKEGSATDFVDSVAAYAPAALGLGLLAYNRSARMRRR